jgi:hypothetical protein
MFVDKVKEAWKYLIGDHLFTILALPVAFFVLFMLPQTANVLWQLPAMSGLTAVETLLSLLLWLFVGILAAAYLLVSWALFRESTDRSSGGARLWRRVRTTRDRVGDGLDAVVERAAEMRAGYTLWVGLLSAVLGTAFFVLTLGNAVVLRAWWRSAGPIYMVLVALIGIWLLSLRAASGQPGFRLKLTGRALVILIASTILGQILWDLPGWLPDLISPRIYTIWAVFQIACVLVTTARLIDNCHAHSAWNIRAMVALGMICWLLLVPGQQVGRFWRLPPRPSDFAGLSSSGGANIGHGRTTAAGATGSPAGGLMPAAQAPQNVLPTARATRNQVMTEPAKSPTLPMRETLIEIWFRAMEARLSDTDPNQPVIFVAASGGGARAAMFTALVFEALRSTELPVSQAEPPAASVGPTGGGARSASATSRSRTLADQIVLISSVSGGSLAAAYYVSQSYPHLRALRDRDLSLDQQIVDIIAPRARIRHGWRNEFPHDVYSRMRVRALRMLDEVRRGRGQTVSAWAGPRFEEAVERVAYECERLGRGRDELPSTNASLTPIAPWLGTSAFVDDMAADCMAPLLRGILTPGLERGVSVTRFWEDQFGWRNVEDTDLHRQPHPTQPELGVITNGAPPILFNTSDVTQGARLILGFPPVPQGIIRDPLARPATHLPYSLTDRSDLYYHVSLAEAVRLSANFPFGFEVAELPLSGGLDTIMALDGGIVDNSGIDSIVYLIQGMNRLARAYRQEWSRLAERYQQQSLSDQDCADLWNELVELSCRSLQGRAYRLMFELARRKVVLLQIDSGTKAIRTTGSGLAQLLASLSPVVFRPFQALNNASYTSAEQAVEQYDLALRTLQPLPVPPCDCAGVEAAAPPSLEGPAPAKTMPAAQAPAPSPRLPIPKPPRDFPPMPPLILRARLTCNQSANVMTAWTLGPEDKAQVLVQFLIEWEHQRPVILKVMEIQSRIELWPRDPTPGAPLYVLHSEELARDYQAFARGQKLADRARAEFYELVSSPAAPRGPVSGPATLALDETSRQDMKDYDQLFRQNRPSPALPGRGSERTTPPRPQPATSPASVPLAPPPPPASATRPPA